MCRFCDNLRQQKESNHETGMTYKYRVNILTEKLKDGIHHSYTNLNGHYEVNYCPECGKKLSQLRACPFCGGRAELSEWNEKNADDSYTYGLGVFCTECGGAYISPGEHEDDYTRNEKDKESTVLRWNRRAGE